MSHAAYGDQESASSTASELSAAWSKYTELARTDSDEHLYKKRAKALATVYNNSSCAFPEPPAMPAFVSYAQADDSVLTNIVRAMSVIAEARSNSAASATFAAVRNALLVAYDLEDKKMSRAAAKGLMRFVEANAKVNELAATNRLLVELDTHRLSSRSLTGIVRATARMNKLLPAWSKVYSRAWHAVEAKGKSPQAMFVGMAEPTEGSVASKAR